jgi:hypothetical protein
VSGDTSCADHLIGWRLRKNLGLDRLKSVGGVGAPPVRPDNIVFDIANGASVSGWGHPSCLGVANAAARAIANALPKVSP